MSCFLEVERAVVRGVEMGMDRRRRGGGGRRR
jgi:hypothetical protein